MIVEDDSALHPAFLDLIDALAPRRHRRGVEYLPFAVLETEMHVRVANGEVRNLRGNVRRLGDVGAQKLAARGHVHEELAHVDNRAGGRAELPFSNQLPALDYDLVAHVRRGFPSLQRELRHGSNGRQRLPTKAERRDVREIVRRVELAGGVALEREARVFRAHTDAIIDNPDAVLAALLDENENRARARIDRVLDELLDD